jgi:hypothetical protein
MAHHWGPDFHHPHHGRMHMTGFKRHREADRSDADRDASGKQDKKPSHGKHARKDQDRKGKDRAGKDKDGNDARQGRAKKPSGGDSAPSKPEAQDD